MGVVVVAVAVVGAGGAWAVMAAQPGSSLDADERAVVHDVESGSHGDAAEATRFVEENTAVLLSEDVAGEIDGGDLAAFFAAALDGDGADVVFETVVAAVAEEGAIHSPELRPVFGQAAEARLTWFDSQINAFTSENADQWSELRVHYDAALVFLREAMRDPAVAERLRQSMTDYGRTEVAIAPASREARMSRLMGVGGVQAFLTLAYYEAEEREARLDSSLDALHAAEEADLERRQVDRVGRAMWVALDRFEWDPSVRARAVGEPFADASGALKSRLTDSETRALEAWVTNESLEGGLLFDDVVFLDAGVAVVRGD